MVIGVVAAAVPLLLRPIPYEPLRPAKKPVVVPVLTERSGNGSKIEKATALVVPPGVVTVTSCDPKGAVASITKFAVTEPPDTDMIPMVTPGRGEIVVLPVAKFFPRSVTLLLLPRTPKDGRISVRPGIPGSTVNVKGAVTPLAVMTTALCVPVCVLGGIVTATTAVVESVIVAVVAGRDPI
jgi:hypothetical protein